MDVIVTCWKNRQIFGQKQKNATDYDCHSNVYTIFEDSVHVTLSKAP